MKRIFTYLTLILALVLVVGASAFFFLKFESSPPEVVALEVPDIMGRQARVSFAVRDTRSGIREVRVYLLQGDRQEVVLEQTYPVNQFRGSETREVRFQVPLEPLKLGFRSGEARIIFQATDASWRNGLKGNTRVAQKRVLLDLDPPRIVVLSSIHYLFPGGSNLVAYRLSEKTKSHGVRLDDLFFKGYDLVDHPGVSFALVGVPVDKKSVSKMVIEAVDLAGNRAELPVPYYLKRKRYRHDTIRITDRFLQRKMPEFLDRYGEIPREDLLQAFLYVNRELRAKNNREIADLCRESRLDRFYVTKPLLRLPRSATRSLFGDQRTYYYRGQKIGEAVHLGVDLASVAASPVPAAAEGVVIFADYLGIYGNTIILDHGLGLFTLYAHLAGFTVSEGDHVRRGQLIAYTDTTGLAGGDHLHFSTLVQGVFVDPVEWFDPHWIKTRITDKLSAAGQGTGAGAEKGS